jgi:hypothetical protein
MPIYPPKYIFFYFTNKCDGLAKIKAGLIFVGWLKVVKSLTIVGTGTCNRTNPSFVGNGDRKLKIDTSG